jgi:hypothetical protein
LVKIKKTHSFATTTTTTTTTTTNITNECIVV